MNQVFLSSEELSSSWLFYIAGIFFYSLWKWFYGYTVVGVENIPSTGALVVGVHTTHNQDIVFSQMGFFEATGRYPRGLLHRTLYAWMPWVRYLGLVAGGRTVAVQLLKQNFVVGVLPGGAEEAMYGHEHAYTLHPRWNDREGFATVAMEANVPIIPSFLRNGEEMRFNPLFYFLNRLGLTKHWQIMIKLPHGIGKVAQEIGQTCWYLCSWISVPVPVRVTQYFGKPMFAKEGERSRQFADRVRDTMQEMIDTLQPHGHAYGPGVVERGIQLLKGLRRNRQKKIN